MSSIAVGLNAWCWAKHGRINSSNYFKITEPLYTVLVKFSSLFSPPMTSTSPEGRVAVVTLCIGAGRYPTLTHEDVAGQKAEILEVLKCLYAVASVLFNDVIQLDILPMDTPPTARRHPPMFATEL